jgi:hypothetical protein
MLLKENSKRVEKYKGYKLYIFDCIKCNSVELKVQQQSIKRHSGKCRSCSQQGEDYFHIYNELKNHRNRKVEFSLSFEDFLTVISKGKCEYCDKVLIYNKHAKNWGKSLTRAHQLDRKDNSKGYTKENVACCCWNCNRLKSDIYSYEEFMLLSPILKEIHKNK